MPGRPSQPCCIDGLGECTACGAKGEFEVVIPSADLTVFDNTLSEENWGYHVVLSEDKKSVEQITDETLVEEWVTDDEPTAFKKGTSHAVCPTCAAELEELKGEVDYDESQVLGTWTYKYVANEKKPETYEEYFLTVSKKNGFYTVNAYYMDVEDGTVDLSESVKQEVSKVKGFVEATSVNALTTVEKDNAFVFTIGDKDYFLTQFAGDDDSASKAYKKGDLAFGVLNDAKLDGSTTVSIGPVKVDTPVAHVHDLVLMDDVRAISSVGSGPETLGHYLACECGLKYVFEEHQDGCECGYETGWQKVSVTCDGDTETYYAPKDYVLKIAAGTEKGTTYTFFNGTVVKYTRAVVTGAEETSGTSYTWDGTTGNGLTVTLTAVVD